MCNRQATNETIQLLASLLEAQTNMIRVCAHAFNPGQVQEYVKLIQKITTKLHDLIDQVNPPR